jgi:hypothetical protein
VPLVEAIVGLGAKFFTQFAEHKLQHGVLVFHARGITVPDGDQVRVEAY